jgi:hypothetical protein
MQVAGKVFFQASNTTAPVLAGATILEAADEAGIFIDTPAAPALAAHAG